MKTRERNKFKSFAHFARFDYGEEVRQKPRPVQSAGRRRKTLRDKLVKDESLPEDHKRWLRDDTDMVNGIIISSQPSEEQAKEYHKWLLRQRAAGLLGGEAAGSSSPTQAQPQTQPQAQAQPQVAQPGAASLAPSPKKRARAKRKDTSTAGKGKGKGVKKARTSVVAEPALPPSFLDMLQRVSGSREVRRATTSPSPRRRGNVGTSARASRWRRGPVKKLRGTVRADDSDGGDAGSATDDDNASTDDDNAPSSVSDDDLTDDEEGDDVSPVETTPTRRVTRKLARTPLTPAQQREKAEAEAKAAARERAREKARRVRARAKARERAAAKAERARRRAAKARDDRAKKKKKKPAVKRPAKVEEPSVPTRTPAFLQVCGAITRLRNNKPLGELRFQYVEDARNLPHRAPGGAAVQTQQQPVQTQQHPVQAQQQPVQAQQQPVQPAQPAAVQQQPVQSSAALMTTRAMELASQMALQQFLQTLLQQLQLIMQEQARLGQQVNVLMGDRADPTELQRTQRMGAQLVELERHLSVLDSSASHHQQQFLQQALAHEQQHAVQQQVAHQMQVAQLAAQQQAVQQVHAAQHLAQQLAQPQQPPLPQQPQQQ